MNRRPSCNRSKATRFIARVLQVAARLARDEDGGAYTLSYVMVVPVLMLLMCLIIEMTLMVTAKVGTVYAAFAGARTASVWASATDWSRAEQKIEQAARQAFVPFASATKPQNESEGNEVNLSSYLQAYRQFAERPASDTYIRNKYRNASGSLTVKSGGPPASWNADFTVTVTYAFPFRIPGIGRMFGEPGGDGSYYLPLVSTATLQNEGPQNESQELGIGYGILE